MTSRRDFLLLTAASSICLHGAAAQPVLPTKPTVPEASKLEDGDLIWPKKPGAYVPYEHTSGLKPVPDETSLWF